MKKYVFLILVLTIILILTSNYLKVKEIKKEENIQVNLYDNNQIINLNLEEYIVGVVACEMPASFHIEALKAMSIASRTYALSKKINNIIETTKTDQCYINEEEMKAKWKDDFEYYYNVIKDVVKQTKNMYMSYENKPIKAFYFSTSNGYTENVESVFHEHLSYLKSVSSPWDIDTRNYLSTIEININEFNSKLGVDKIEVINIISRNSTNRVEKIKVNNKEITGVEFRKLLGLRSTDFDIEYNSETVKITTRGYGHGVGMSQYGANGMANEGYKYEDILKYYYKNIEILSV